MSYEYRVLSAAELVESAQAWDDLWLRSALGQPTVRAEGIACWLRSFSSPEDLRAVVVKRDGRFVAAMPLVRKRVAGLYPVYELPVNCWANCGDLLLDKQSNTTELVEELLKALKRASIKLLMLDEISLEAPRWRQFRQLVAAQGSVYVAGQHPVGVIDVLHDFSAYEAWWPSKFRNSVRRCKKKLGSLGDVGVHRHRNLSAAEVELYMQMAFEVEHRSWKGANGTSILSTPGMAEYMLSEARAIAAAGMLEIWMLTLDDLPIAFEYCHFAKGVCFAQKIGYDPAYRQCGPGKLLRYHQLQAYHDQADCHLLDTLGLFCSTKAKWATRTYQAGRVYASVGSPLSSFLVQAFARTAPIWKSLRSPTGRKQEIIPTPAAAGYLLSARESVGSNPESVSC